MHVLIVTPEILPFCSSGDMGELAWNLARGLHERRVQVSVLAPFHGSISSERFNLARRIRKVTVPAGAGEVEVGLFDGNIPGTDVGVIFVDHPPSFDRPGLYGDAEGDYADNHLRFNLLCRSVLSITAELNLVPDVIHTFGWQTGLLPLLLRRGGVDSPLAGAKLVHTIGNAGELGLFDASELDRLGLGRDLFTPDGVEFFARGSLLKAGIVYSDRVLATSPSYAREICTEEHGGGLHGLFSSLGERLVGVPTAINYGMWNTDGDHRIPAHFGVEDLGGKAESKRALQVELGLQARQELPLVALAGPFSEDNGSRLVADALERFPQLQLVLAGDDERCAALLRVESPATVARLPGADVDATHRLLAGADAVLMPRRHEPGGHLQLKALRFGAVPVATAVGGLRDTLVDFDAKTGTGTAILFPRFEADSLLTALERVVLLHADEDAWGTLTRNAMRQRFGIELMSGRYLEVYEGLLPEGSTEPG